jgi:subtilisin family serine protease
MFAAALAVSLWSIDVFAQQAAPQFAADTFGGFPTTHILVRTKPGVKPTLLADGRWTFDLSAQAKATGKKSVSAQTVNGLATALQRNNVRGVKASPVSQAANAALANQIGLNRYYHIEVPPGSDVQKMVAELSTFTTLFDSVQLDGIGGIAAIPNDTSFGTQWNMHNIGQSGGVVDADVDAPEMWDVFQGDDTITLAIIDTGVQATHPDLAGRVLQGWNTNVTPNNNNADDLNGHGTHVSGIAAATGNNGYGVAGMNWNINILPVRCVNASGSGTEAMCAAAIIWAADHGADVISMSLQYYTGTTELHDAVIYANNLGVLLIAATGNGASPGTVAFPARWDECMGVAASNRFDLIYSLSNSGPTVDLAAPGQDVYSLWKDSGFLAISGTSMATPHVSGLATLLMERNPALTREQVINILKTTVVDKGAPGWDASFGWGVINARRALYVALPKTGDINLDEVVNMTDLLVVIAQWGNCPAPCPADVNGSGIVDITDLLAVIANWG